MTDLLILVIGIVCVAFFAGLLILVDRVRG